MLRKSIINAIRAFKHENVSLSMVPNETKFYKRRSTAKMIKFTKCHTQHSEETVLF